MSSRCMPHQPCHCSHVESRQEPERLRGLDQRGGTHGARRGQAAIAALCAEPCIPAAPALVTANAEGDVGVGGAHVWAHVAGFAQHGVEGDSIQGKGNRGGAEVEALAGGAGARFGIGVAPFATFMPIAQVGRRGIRSGLQRAWARTVEPAGAIAPLQRSFAAPCRPVAASTEGTDQVLRGLRMPVAAVAGQVVDTVQVDAGEPAIAVAAQAAGGRLQAILRGVAPAAQAGLQHGFGPIGLVTQDDVDHAGDGIGAASG
ncbi:hypothetical protein G6F24_014372 [Rhizopus arrhizus]|nr:hypothetical protein G6F24_014372 [Rhizopus arrhizus]